MVASSTQLLAPEVETLTVLVAVFDLPPFEAVSATENAPAVENAWVGFSARSTQSRLRSSMTKTSALRSRYR